MRLRKWDAAGDVRYGHGQADYWINTPEGVAQAVVQRLRLARGEWFLDSSEGTPWDSAILGKHQADTHDPVIRERILDTEGVVSLDEYSSNQDPDSRALVIQATITTQYGEATILEVL